ncbi:MAG: iron chelate uptake ABC transporter family permease subunit [Acidobacteria bacterium]|nr:iron chelate uptake ABC transporter family permease subunit [Acidobacteriota bacterium]
MLTPEKFGRALAAAVGLLLAAVALAPLIGSSPISLERAFQGESPDAEILFDIRLTRTLLAAAAGGALALAGVIFQALLRDALATPFTLGVSNGAALGAVVAICFGWGTVGELSALGLAAMVGALAVMGAVLKIASEGRRMSSFTLLLTGVTINSICMAAILFLHSSAGFIQSFAIVRWLMGGIDSPRPATLAAVGAGVLVALGLTMAKAKDLNLLAVGEDWALTRGTDVRALMRFCFVLGSFLTAVITAMTGPIGFIGLITPHALRMVVGADHRLLVPASFCVGGAFLVVCDTAARTMMAPAEIPVGVITSMLGGPFFIWLLRSRRARVWL